MPNIAVALPQDASASLEAAPIEWRRIGSAYAVAVITALGLMAAHVAWAPAWLAGVAGGLFVWWRSVAGVLSAFTVFCVSAAVAWPPHAGGAPLPLGAALPWAVALEVYGVLTLVAVARVRHPRRLSRRLLNSYLSSTGIGLLGVALCGAPATQAAGTTLIVGALVYRIGAVPTYAWLPLLLRHESRAIKLTGVVGLGVAGAVLLRVWPLLPDHAPATATLAALPAAALPWALWRAWRQRRIDPACARTFGIVALSAAVLLGAAAWAAR